MSTLEVSNLNDGTTTVATTFVTNGSAKAWVNFNGSGTIAARGSLNLSSLTDNANGDYTITVSSALANTNYAVSHGVAQGEASGSTASAGIKTSGTGNDDSLVTYSTTATRLIIRRDNGSNENTILVCSNIHGDLA